MQRLGVRRTTIIALTLLTASVSLATLVRQPGQLVLRWGVVGSGSGMAALVLGATIVNRWFVARRGLALGILTASTATGQLIFLRCSRRSSSETAGDSGFSSSPQPPRS